MIAIGQTCLASRRRRRLASAAVPEAKLFLACDAGFDRELLRLDRSRGDVELVDADRLLHGS